jgi:UDP-glucose 4-epimerase
MSKILITGPLGHIGSKFIHGLSKEEFEEVRLFDNLSTQRYSSLFNLPEGVKFNFYEEDVCTASLEKYFKDIDLVLHLAAITNAPASFEIQEEVEKVNYEGTKRVARACINCGCKLILLSTTSVYGTQKNVVDENCSIEELKPQSPYAESKLKAENLLKQLGEENLKFIILRFGTIFGPSTGMRFHTAINKFVWQACTGQPITVWRTALHQKRPYLDLSDAIRAIKFIINKDIFDNNIYNVLTVNVAVSEIIETIKLFIPDITTTYVDSKIMNQLSYTVSSDKFKSLGFNIQGDLKKGIEDTINLLKSIRYYDEIYKG